MYPVGWLSDGAFVWATDSAAQLQDRGIWITSAPPGDDRQFVKDDPVDSARFCPSGARIAYASARSGRREIYVDTFPTSSGRPVRVSRNGGNHPRWRADGRDVFFLERTHLMAVPLDTAPSLQEGRPTPLFALKPTGAQGPYDVAAEGRRFQLTLNSAAGDSTRRSWLSG